MDGDELQSRLRTSGWMMKKGSSRTRSAWKKRWFVLDGFVLKYYKSPEDVDKRTGCRGAIALSGAELYTAVHETWGSRYMELHVPTWRLKYPLVCQDGGEYVQWLQTLIYVVNLALDNGVPPGQDGEGGVVSPLTTGGGRGGGGAGAGSAEEEEEHDAGEEERVAASPPPPLRDAGRGEDGTPATGAEGSSRPDVAPDAVQSSRAAGTGLLSPGLPMTGTTGGEQRQEDTGPLRAERVVRAPEAAAVALEVQPQQQAQQEQPPVAVAGSAEANSTATRRSLAAMIKAAAASGAEGERTKMAVGDVLSAWTIDDNEAWLSAHMPHASAAAIMAQRSAVQPHPSLLAAAFAQTGAAHASPEPVRNGQAHMTEALAHLLQLPSPSQAAEFRASGFGSAGHTRSATRPAPAKTAAEAHGEEEQADFSPLRSFPGHEAGLSPPTGERSPAPATSAERAMALEDLLAAGLPPPPPPPPQGAAAGFKPKRSKSLSAVPEAGKRFADSGVQWEAPDVELARVEAATRTSVATQSVSFLEDAGLPLDASALMNSPPRPAQGESVGAGGRTAAAAQAGGQGVTSLGAPIAGGAFPSAAIPAAAPPAGTAAALLTTTSSTVPPPVFASRPTPGDVIGFHSDADKPAAVNPRAAALEVAHTGTAAGSGHGKVESSAPSGTGHGHGRDPYASAKADAAHAKAAAQPPTIPVRQTRKASAMASAGMARRRSIESAERVALADLNRPFTARAVPPSSAHPPPPPPTSASSVTKAAGTAQGRGKAGAHVDDPVPTIEVSLQLAEGRSRAQPLLPAVPPVAPSAAAAAASQLAMAMPIVQAEYAYSDFAGAIAAVSSDCKLLFDRYSGRGVSGHSVVEVPPHGVLTHAQLQALAADAGLTDGTAVPAAAPLSTAHVEAIYQRLASSSLAVTVMAAKAGSGTSGGTAGRALPLGLSYPQFVSAMLMCAVLAFGPTHAQSPPAGSAVQPSPLRRLSRRHLSPLVAGRAGRPRPQQGNNTSVGAASLTSALMASVLLGGPGDSTAGADLTSSTLLGGRSFMGGPFVAPPPTQPSVQQGGTSAQQLQAVTRLFYGEDGLPSSSAPEHDEEVVFDSFVPLSASDVEAGGWKENEPSQSEDIDGAGVGVRGAEGGAVQSDSAVEQEEGEEEEEDEEETKDVVWRGEGDGGDPPLHADTAPSSPASSSPPPTVDLGLGLLSDLADKIAAITSPLPPLAPSAAMAIPTAPTSPPPMRPTPVDTHRRMEFADLLVGVPAPHGPSSTFPSALGHLPLLGVEEPMSTRSPAHRLGAHVPGLKQADYPLAEPGVGSPSRAMVAAGRALPPAATTAGQASSYAGGGAGGAEGHGRNSAPRATLTTAQPLPLALGAPVTPAVLVPDRYLRSLTGGGPASALAIPGLRAVLLADAKAIKAIHAHYADLRASNAPAIIKNSGKLQQRSALVAAHLLTSKHASGGAFEGWQAQARSALTSTPPSVLMDRSVLLPADVLRVALEFAVVPALLSNAGVRSVFTSVAQPLPSVQCADGSPVLALDLPAFMEVVGRVALAAYALQGPFLPPPQAGLMLLQWMDKSSGRESMLRENRGAPALRFAARTSFK